MNFEANPLMKLNKGEYDFFLEFFENKVLHKYVKQRLVQFMNNAQTLDDENFLKELIKHIVIYRYDDVTQFISEKIDPSIISDQNFAVMQFETKNNSYRSNEYIVSSLSAELFGGSKTIILNINDNKEYDTEKNNIIITDDFSGSGNTILEGIRNIVNLESKKLFIFSYVMTETALKSIENELNEKKIKYKIFRTDKEILFDKLIIEEYKSHLEKLEESIEFNSQIFWGYENIGTMALRELSSSNTNLGIIWNGKGQYNGKKWYPLADRKFNIISAKKNSDDCYILANYDIDEKDLNCLKNNSYPISANEERLKNLSENEKNDIIDYVNKYIKNTNTKIYKYKNNN
jgi:hypothetical protein